jgi:hypothetical protein
MGPNCAYQTMPEVAPELLARLRRNEIDIPAFVREAEKLPDDEWQRLSALVLQWFAQQKVESSRASYSGGDATNR